MPKFTRAYGHFGIVCAVLILCSIYYWNVLRSKDRYAQYESDGYFGCSCTSISVENESCYFSTPASGKGDIYQAFLSEKRFVPIVATGQTEYDPVLSANRGHLAFIRCDSSGAAQIWRKDLKSGVESAVTACSPNDFLVGISDDSSYVIVERGRFTGGLGRLMKSAVISTDSYAEKDLESEMGVHIWSGSKVLCTRGSESARQVVVYDVSRDASTVLCSGTATFVIDETRALVRKSDGDLCVVDADGKVVRTISNVSDSDRVACGGGWIANTNKRRSSIIVQQLDRKDTVIHLPTVGADYAITGLCASAHGFVVVVRSHDLNGWSERVLTTSAPFQQWESRFSTAPLQWD